MNKWEMIKLFLVDNGVDISGKDNDMLFKDLLRLLLECDSDAQSISYNNATSGLTSDNVQGAIDELANEVLGINDALGSGVIV